MKDVIEIESYLHPIELVDSNEDTNQKGKEVILKIIDRSIDNKNTFYTDSNGLELQKRIVDYRPSWDLKVNEHVAGNYYPVNAMIGISDGSRSMFILNDRS